MAGVRDYGYLNARIRARRSLLLGRDAILRLAGLPDTGLGLAELAGTPYAPEVGGLASDCSPLEIDLAVQAHLRRTFGSLRTWARGGASAAVDMVLSKGDVTDLKTVFRGKWGGRSAPEILGALNGFGSLPARAWEELAAQPDVRACISTLGRWRPEWAEALEEVARMPMSGVADLEERLDVVYHRDLLGGREITSRSDREVLALFARGLIDLSNLRALVRLDGSAVDRDQARRSYLPGGRVSLDEFAALWEGRDRGDLLPRMKSRRVAEIAREVYLRLSTKGRTSAERVIDLEERHLAHGLYLSPPLGIGPVVGWVWEKLWEAQLVRLILRGKREGLAPELVAEEVLVG